jgi:beta-phosphoglucomutase
MTRCLEAIIFDFDGVIADSERLHLLAYQQVLTPLGLELTEDAYYRQYLGYDDLGVFRSYARNNGLAWDDPTVFDLVAAKGKRFAQMSARGEMLYPGSAAFIREAANAVPIAIASGALTHEIEELLSRVELLDLFAAIVGADQTTRSKPSPDPYLEAFRRLNDNGRSLDPSRTVAIEDSHWGLASAATAGLRCVAVTNTYTAEELAPHAELVVKGLDALALETLDALCERP